MQSDSPYRLLVVDDEPQITRVLKSALASSGYEVKVAHNAEEALDLAAKWPPEMVITDLVMPGMDGVALCRELRAHSDVPILVLSVRDQDQQKIQALDAGADDYVTKPFSIQELLARVRAHIRRKNLSKPPVEETSLTVGDFFIDRDRRIVEVKEREIHLTPKEFDLLVFMAERPERVLTHRTLLSAIWGPHSVDQPEALRVLVGQLRKKIESTPEPHYIVNEPWVGYRFHPVSESGNSL